MAEKLICLVYCNDVAGSLPRRVKGGFGPRKRNLAYCVVLGALSHR